METQRVHSRVTVQYVRFTSACGGFLAGLRLDEWEFTLQNKRLRMLEVKCRFPLSKPPCPGRNGHAPVTRSSGFPLEPIG
jgi:hypothetical protein